MSNPVTVIYVIDDDASFRTAIVRLLKASSYEVIVHKSANEFFEKPPSMDRGCILLDLKMPGLDGLQVQNRLSNLGSHLPIVFLTGYGDIATTVRAIKAGAEDFLPKPVVKAQLLECNWARAHAFRRSPRTELATWRSSKAGGDPYAPRAGSLRLGGSRQAQQADCP